MDEDTRWLRLNVDWSNSEWLAALPWAVRSVWTQFLPHIKLFGNNRGKCKTMSHVVFARMYDIPLEYVEAFISAAIAAGALKIEKGIWVVTEWQKYQSPDASRKRGERTGQGHADTDSAGQEEMSQDKDDISNTTVHCPEKLGQPQIVTDKRDLSGLLSRDIDSDIDKDSNTAASYLVGGGGGEIAEQWDAVLCVELDDPLVARVYACIGAVKAFRAQPPPNLKSVQIMLDDLRTHAPSDGDIDGQLERWMNANMNLKLAGDSPPVNRIWNWIGSAKTLKTWKERKDALASEPPKTGEDLKKQQIAEIKAIRGIA